MTAVIIIFMVLATLIALSSIGYVTADVIIEKREQKKREEELPPPLVVVAPIEEDEEEEEAEEEIELMPEFVEHIEAEEADSMISDSLAMKHAKYEQGAGHGLQGIINIGVIDQSFDANDVVTLEALKKKGLAPASVCRLKVLAGGALNKPLTIKAEHYSVQAIKMIELTGGTVIILKG